MLKVAICDDDVSEVKKIESFIRVYDDFDITAYTSSKRLANVIRDGAVFDVYLLDVVMPRPDGIELARLIRKMDEKAVIIYLTSHDGRALDAFRVRASQYLSKPVNRETLYRELDTALTAVKAKTSKTFLLKTKDGAEAIPFHRIVCCELEGRVLCCVTADGEKHRSVTLRSSFDDAVSALTADDRFIRPHTSFVVNMDYVKSIQGNFFLMKTGSNIPIARRTLGEIKEKYLRYFFRGEE